MLVQIPYKKDFLLTIDPDTEDKLTITWLDREAETEHDFTNAVKIMSDANLDFTSPVTGDTLFEVMSTINNIIQLGYLQHCVDNY